MPDNRVALASDFAMAPADEVSARDKGIAPRATEPRGGGPYGAAVPGSGGDTPVGGQIDGAVAAEAPSKGMAPTPRHAAPPPEPGAQTFPESLRQDFGGRGHAFPKNPDPIH